MRDTLVFMVGYNYRTCIVHTFHWIQIQLNASEFQASILTIPPSSLSFPTTVSYSVFPSIILASHSVQLYFVSVSSLHHAAIFITSSPSVFPATSACSHQFPPIIRFPYPLPLLLPCIMQPFLSLLHTIFIPLTCIDTHHRKVHSVLTFLLTHLPIFSPPYDPWK